MSDNWHQKIKDFYTQKQEVEVDNQKQLKTKDEQERQKKFVELGRRFHCHVCQVSSKTPGFRKISPERSAIDWNIPGDMSKCSICHKWTCGEHIFAEICQKCSETL